jgi:CRISPR-associated protein Cmr2
VLRLLYAPLPGGGVREAVERIDAIQKLLDAAEQLLTVYGFSAKRTAGWGIAEVTGARASGGQWQKENPFQELNGKIPALLGSRVDKA